MVKPRKIDYKKSFGESASTIALWIASDLVLDLSEEKEEEVQDVQFTVPEVARHAEEYYPVFKINLDNVHVSLDVFNYKYFRKNRESRYYSLDIRQNGLQYNKAALKKLLKKASTQNIVYQKGTGEPEVENPTNLPVLSPNQEIINYLKVKFRKLRNKLNSSKERENEILKNQKKILKKLQNKLNSSKERENEILKNQKKILKKLQLIKNLLDEII